MTTLRQMSALARSITGRVVSGFDGRPLLEGGRCELHPATDLWIRGARFGRVVKVWRHPVSGVTMVTVQLDRLKKTTVIQPENVRPLQFDDPSEEE